MILSVWQMEPMSPLQSPLTTGGPDRGHILPSRAHTGLAALQSQLKESEAHLADFSNIQNGNAAQHIQPVRIIQQANILCCLPARQHNHRRLIIKPLCPTLHLDSQSHLYSQSQDKRIAPWNIHLFCYFKVAKLKGEKSICVCYATSSLHENIR